MPWGAFRNGNWRSAETICSPESQGQEHTAWWQAQIAALPSAYLTGNRAEQVLADLQRLVGLSRRDAVAWGRYQPDTRAVQYTIGTYEDITQGIFHKTHGVLSSQRMQFCPPRSIPWPTAWCWTISMSRIRISRVNRHRIGSAKSVRSCGGTEAGHLRAADVPAGLGC